MRILTDWGIVLGTALFATAVMVLFISMKFAPQGSSQLQTSRHAGVWYREGKSCVSSQSFRP